VITRRKRTILELAVATACFGAAAVMPLTAVAAPQNANAPTAAPSSKSVKTPSAIANEKLLKPVMINGFISSIQNSIAIQKNSNSIVEAISAQDIGRLPATSIASAFEQLPGVSVQMVGGEPEAVNFHGLGEDFSTALVDGVEQVTTAENRGVHFNQYPPGWFKAIKLYVSPKADLIGQGMAATFEMQTWKPLEEKGPQGALNADYTWLTPGDLMPGPGVNDKGYDVNGMYMTQFDHHKLGVMVGVDLSAQPEKRLREAPYGYANESGVLVIGGSKNYNYSVLRKRESFITTFQYRPSSVYDTTLNLTYERYHKTTQRKGMEFPLAYSAAQLVSLGPVVNGFAQSGTFDEVYPVIRNDYNHHHDRVYNIDWQNRVRFPDSWIGRFQASYNSAMRIYGKLESYSGFGYDGPANESTVPPSTVNFSYAPDGQLLLSSPQNFASPSIVLTDPQGWGAGAGLVQQGFLNQLHNDEYLANFKLSAQHFFSSGPISSMNVGVDYSHHHKNLDLTQDYVVLPGSCYIFSSTCTPTETAPIPASASLGSVDALSYMGIGPQVAYNPNALLASGADLFYPTSNSNTGPLGPPDWTLHEDDTYGFVQFDLQTTLGSDVGLRGNFGVQVAHTAQESRGSRIAPPATPGGPSILVPMTGGTSYTRVLPSLNLVFSFPHNYDARLGIARTMARPLMTAMADSLSIGTNPTYLTSTNPNQAYFSGGGGNPDLLPTMATNFNLSLEKYFTGSGYHCTPGERAENSSLCLSGGAGFVQLAGFYLSLSNYINESAATLYNFAPFESSYLTAAQQQELGTTYGTLTIPNNDGSGHIYGAQLATNLPFGDLTHWLNGFGVEASGTLTHSAVYYAGNTQPVTVLGLAKWVENYTLYYAYRGFEADVNFNSRTKALADIYGISETRQEDMQRAQHWISAQVSYEFQGGALNGLTLIASGQNLGNEVQEEYQNNDPRQVIRWEEYGRTFNVGFSYRFE
jgi:iron complex outermembrane receptor protein